MKENLTFGLIVGNRGFFPAHLCKSGRETIISILKKERISVITLSENDTKFGSLETWQDTKKCIELFKNNRDKIDGIVVTLPNFGDERAVADAIRFSELNVPVLIHAWPDEIDKMDIQNRRDSFCGKISVCNNLSQYGIKFSLTSLHTIDPARKSFRRDLDRFVKICRILKGLKNVKLGAIGTRPSAFKTVRYSEKLLEKNGISVDTLDLSEVFARIGKLSDENKKVKDEIKVLKNYADFSLVPPQALIKMAKLKIVLEDWINELDLNGIALQCWTSIEENYGIVPCAVMSYFTNSLIPAACEVDITGTLSMFILQLASNTPSAIVDFNNNYGNEINKCVIFHCSNLPVYMFKKAKIECQEIISTSVGRDNAYGSVVGKVKASPLTYLRLTTDEELGEIRGYIGEGRLTDDPIKTFGGHGVVEIPQLQNLLRIICETGYEHHTVINLSQVASAVEEALIKYKGWNIYRHS